MRGSLIALALMFLPHCGATPAAHELELDPSQLPQSGGELILRGRMAGGGAIVVLVDGIAAESVVRESAEVLRVRVPSLPRTGTVDVELHFADGSEQRLAEALLVDAPPLVVEP